MLEDKKIKSSRQRIVVVVVVLICFFIGFTAMGTSYIKKFDRALQEENRIHLSEIADYIAFHMQTVIKDTQESLELSAKALTQIDTDQAKSEYTRTIAKQYSFAYVGYADANGMLHATVPSESVNIGEEAYFKSAVQGNNAVSDVTRKIFKDRAVSGVILSVPLVKKDGEKGALIAMLDIAKLGEALSIESFGGQGYSYVIDKNGDTILRTKSLDFNNLFKAWQNMDFADGYSLTQFEEDVKNKQEGIVQFSDLGVQKYAYYKPAGFNDWTVINIVSRNAVAGKTVALTRDLATIGVVTIVVFMGLILFAVISYAVSRGQKQAADEKTAFLANVSHEIRTPMNAIMGISEILLRDDLSSGQRDHVLSIRNAGKGLLAIINDILDLSKLNAGKFTMIEEPYEVESLLYDVGVITSIRIENKPIEFIMNLDPNVPRILIGDMGRVKQVLLNIVGNAIKFTEKGSITLSVGCEQEGDFIALNMEVKDTGIGIREEDMDKLFGSFNQVDTHRNRNVEGTGLGLSITQKLCTMMNGKITVESEYGKGSTFKITIKQGISDEAPIQLAGMLEAEDSYVPKIRNIEDTSVLEPFFHVSILIVDDNEVNLQVATGLMEPYRMQIDCVSSGYEAIEAVQNADYDLLFMDHMMPEMDGIETARHIRALSGEKYQKLPIIALTANATNGARRLFDKEGFNGFLSKPIEIYELDQILKKWLKDINREREEAEPKKGQVSEGYKKTHDMLEWLLKYKTGEVDFREGLKRMGSLSVYRKILKTYKESTKERLGHLDLWLKSDKERFVIEIHGLKGASAAVAAFGLADLAEKIENLGHLNDFKRIQTLLPSFLTREEQALKEIKMFLEKTEAKPEENNSDNEEARQKIDQKEKRHIVVVDDNPVNLELAESVLKEQYRLSKLNSGEALLDFLKRDKPDMILLDIQMPGIGGYETLKRIRNNPDHRSIPVIFLTGQKDILSEQEGFRLGAKDFISKPFDNIVMLSRIRAQMELYEYQTDLEKIVQEKTGKIEDLQQVITMSWAEAIESRDGTTGSHVRNTTRYFEAFLRILGQKESYKAAFLEETRSDMLKASAMHDVGKIGISDMVLKKPGPLTIEEYERMKEHSEIGAEMIRKLIGTAHPDRFLLYALDMARYHHEHWDGTGYPCRLEKNEIPLYVQVLSIVDVFDALTAVRPYKRAFTLEEALEIMQKDRGKFFSPELFDIFYENREIMKQVLETKES